MFLSIFKKGFWLWYDYITRIFLVSILWFILNIPLFFFLIAEFYLKPISIFRLGIFLIIILFSPFSISVYDYFMQTILQDKKIPIIEYFKDIKKFFFKGMLLIGINIIIFILFYVGFKFYLKQRSFFGYILTASLLWIFFYYCLMSDYFIPILVYKKNNVLKTIYKSLLLTMDNFFVSFSFFIINISFLIISLFSIIGFPFLFIGIVSLLDNTKMLFLLSKYDENVKIEKETRSFKNLLKPWL